MIHEMIKIFHCDSSYQLWIVQRKHRKEKLPCSYWREKGIAYVPSWPLVGSLGTVLFRRKSLREAIVDIYNQFPNERYVGYMRFARNHLLLRDVELIKQIFVKEFRYFNDRNPIVGGINDPLLFRSLIVLKGTEWRNMRTTLSAAFTINKIKNNMYYLMTECSEKLVNNFQNEVEVEVNELFSKFASDVIASAAFGIQLNLVDNSNNEFYMMTKNLNEFNTSRVLKLILREIAKPVADLFGIQLFPKYVIPFFKTIIMENIRERETKGIIRPDLIHLLMEAKKGKLKLENVKEEKIGFATVEEAESDPTSKVSFTDNDIVAQAILFFFGGFETVYATASFMSYELAINPDIQKKLHEEIDAVYQKHQHKVPYEALLSIKYLDQVISETLRLWGPGFQTDRVCVKNFVIQPVTPDEKPFMIEKGVTVMIPIAALHLDPQYYPEPTKFDPERFNGINKSKIVPGTYLPFGIGPRNCIGSRFAILELKTLFYHLLAKFEIVPIDKTEIPLKISKKNLRLTTDGGIWLGLKLRRNPS